jgi:alpha-ketoglutarate-dependent taurine dioxygenase
MTPDQLGHIRNELHTSGHVMLRGAGTHSLVELLESLGRILHVEEVVVDPASGSLVKSPHGLSLHTDHHRADIIVWYCIAQSDDGGTTVLADGIRAYRTLSVEMREALRDVSLQEHSVFRGDQERHPVISVRNGVERLYYSYSEQSPHFYSTPKSFLNTACFAT